MTTHNHDYLTQPVTPADAHPRVPANQLLDGPTGSRPNSQTVLLKHPPRPSTRDLLMVICVDVSSSMNSPCGRSTRLGVGQQSLMTAAAQTARRTPQALFGVIGFNDAPMLVTQPVPVAEHCEKICSAIQTTQAGGGTRLDLALEMGEAIFEQHPDRNAKSVLILTDGHSAGYVEEAADQLKAMGVQIFVTGIGHVPTDVNEDLLRSIASVVDGEPAYQFVTNASGMKSTVLMHSQLATRRF